LNEKRSIYEAWMKKTDSWQSHNNYAAVHIDLAKKETDKAKIAELADAAIVHAQASNNKQENAEAYNNLAVAYTMKGQKAEARDARNQANQPPRQLGQGLRDDGGGNHAVRAKLAEAVALN
jgi:hypothetical protein